MKNNIVVYITGHGYGHLSQTIEVLIALYKKPPNIQFQIITSISEGMVNTRLANKIPTSKVSYISDESGVDMGVPMVDAMQVDREKTVIAYKEIHNNWEHYVSLEEQRLIELKPAMVLCNVGYIPLQAAANLNIPAVALCSLDWASTWQVFGSRDDEGKAILNQMIEAYRSAKIFCKLTPHLPMPFLDNTISVPFIVRQGVSKRQLIDQSFPQCLGKKLILISMGGMDANINFGQWQKNEQVVYVVTGSNALPCGFIHADDFGLDFSDVIASVDIVLTKTGYGMVVESAVNQIPLFYVARKDWPEHEVMVNWAKDNNQVLEVDREDFERGLTMDKIEALMSLPAKNKVFNIGLGADVCADHIMLLMRD